jgi:hypothetical protein
MWNTISAVLARLAALGLGGYLAYCEVTGTYEYYLADQDGVVNYIVKATVAITLVTALAPTFISMAFRARHWLLGSMLTVALLAAILVVFGAAVSRTGGNADTADQTRIKVERATKLAEKTEVEATEALKNATSEAVKECNTTTKGGTGRGDKCLLAESKRDTAQAALDKAREDLKNVGIIRRDPWGVRIAAMTGGRISEDDVRTYWPITVPLVVSIFAGLLIQFGAHLKLTPSTPVAPQSPGPLPAPAARRQRWILPSVMRQEPEPAAVQTPVAAAALPVAARAIDAVLPAEPMQPAFRRQKPSLKLVASNNVADMHGVVDFILEGLESGPGSRVSEKDCYKAYARACKAAGAKPVTPEDFVPMLDKACTDCAIARTHKSGQVYLVDVQLVNKASKAS